MPVIPPLPGSWGAGTAASRGVREEVNRQFAVSAAAAGPSEHVLGGHSPPGAGKSAAGHEPHHPQPQKGPREGCWQPSLQERGALFFLTP